MMECNFPLVCGVSKGICCRYCDKECQYKCELEPLNCELSQETCNK